MTNTTVQRNVDMLASKISFKHESVNKKKATFANFARTDRQIGEGIFRLKKNLPNKNKFQDLFNKNGKVSPKKLSIAAIAICNMENITNITADDLYSRLCKWWRWYSSNDIITKSQMLRALTVLNDLGLIIKYKERASLGNHKLSYFIPKQSLALLGIDLMKELNFLRIKFDLIEKKITAQIILNKEKDNTKISNDPQVVREESKVIPKNVDKIVNSDNKINLSYREVIISLNGREYLSNGKEVLMEINNELVKAGQTQLSKDFSLDSHTVTWCRNEMEISKEVMNKALDKFTIHHFEKKDHAYDWNIKFRSWIRRGLEEKWIKPTKFEEYKPTPISSGKFDKNNLRGIHKPDYSQDLIRNAILRDKTIAHMWED